MRIGGCSARHLPITLFPRRRQTLDTLILLSAFFLVPSAALPYIFHANFTLSLALVLVLSGCRHRDAVSKSTESPMATAVPDRGELIGPLHCGPRCAAEVAIDHALQARDAGGDEGGAERYLQPDCTGYV